MLENIWIYLHDSYISHFLSIINIWNLFLCVGKFPSPSLSYQRETNETADALVKTSLNLTEDKVFDNASVSLVLINDSCTIFFLEVSSLLLGFFHFVQKKN